MHKLISVTALMLTLVWPSMAVSDVAGKLRGMEGWTIIAITQVEDEFEGCDFDKIIKFLNGMALECSTYSYTYSFMPNAVIFAKDAKHERLEFYQIKALIGDEIYDMAPQLKK